MSSSKVPPHADEDDKVVLTVRCTQAEAQAIREEARLAHRSISSLFLEAVVEYIWHRKHSHPHMPSAEDPPE